MVKCRLCPTRTLIAPLSLHLQSAPAALPLAVAVDDVARLAGAGGGRGATDRPRRRAREHLPPPLYVSACLSPPREEENLNKPENCALLIHSACAYQFEIGTIIHFSP